MGERRLFLEARSQGGGWRGSREKFFMTEIKWFSEAWGAGGEATERGLKRRLPTWWATHIIIFHKS